MSAIHILSISLHPLKDKNRDKYMYFDIITIKIKIKVKLIQIYLSKYNIY